MQTGIIEKCLPYLSVCFIARDIRQAFQCSLYFFNPLSGAERLLFPHRTHSTTITTRMSCSRYNTVMIEMETIRCMIPRIICSCVRPIVAYGTDTGHFPFCRLIFLVIQGASETTSGIIGFSFTGVEFPVYHSISVKHPPLSFGKILGRSKP